MTNSLDHAHALALKERIHREHPSWFVGLCLPDSYGPFAVQAWTPLLPALFYTVAEYEALEVGHDAHPE